MWQTYFCKRSKILSPMPSAWFHVRKYAGWTTARRAMIQNQRKNVNCIVSPEYQCEFLWSSNPSFFIRVFIDTAYAAKKHQLFSIPIHHSRKRDSESYRSYSIGCTGTTYNRGTHQRCSRSTNLDTSTSYRFHSWDHFFPVYRQIVRFESVWESDWIMRAINVGHTLLYFTIRLTDR